MKKTYLNNEPFKERKCPECGKMLRQTRVRIGKNGLKCYRIWVHKGTRKKACEGKEEKVFTHKHKPTCSCPYCEQRRETTGQ